MGCADANAFSLEVLCISVRRQGRARSAAVDGGFAGACRSREAEAEADEEEDDEEE